MKKLFLFAGVLLMGGIAVAKPVSVETAKTAGYRFLAKKLGSDVALNVNSLELVYTAQSQGSNPVNYYYIFNANGNSFVMVSADDQATPIFGYSKEAGYKPNNVPTNSVEWMDNYKNQIKYIIDNNVPANAETAGEWAMLLEGKGPGLRTTATTVVDPLLTTIWGQDPFYNELCPFDSWENQSTVSGCVATAMAQVMKYWNWPRQGNGSHGYSSDYGFLTADFGATTYEWGNMPNSLMASNTPVATLMLHAGIAVDMGYGTASSGGSGAFVTISQSPVTNCAEYAFTNYFRYDANTTRGVNRQGMTEAKWISLLKSEIDTGRPVLYAGFGSAGGHAWVADGYDDANFFHINWGWNGSSNGYFKVSAMNPPALGTGGGSGGFNSNQHVIVGIQPDPSAFLTPDQYEDNNAAKKAHDLSVNFNGNTGVAKTQNADFHITNDMDYYKFFLPVGDNYKVNVRVHDQANSNDGNTYTVNSKISYSKTNIAYSGYREETIEDISMPGGGYLYVRVMPSVAGEMGTYSLEVNVERTPTSVTDVNGGEDISIYPNPASNMLNIVLNSAKAEIAVVDMQGRVMQRASSIGQQLFTMPVGQLANGIYFVQVKTDKATTTHKVVIEK